jgi:hypothetical protein
VCDITLFAHVGVSAEDIAIKDMYSDFRVEVLMRAVPRLLGARGPITSICGTMLFFTCLFVGKVSELNGWESPAFSPSISSTFSLFLFLLPLVYLHFGGSLPFAYF